MNEVVSDLLLKMLQCPCCHHHPLIRYTDGSFKCSDKACFAYDHPFDVVHGQPLLIDFRNSLFKKGNFLNDKKGEVVARKKGLFSVAAKRLLWGDSSVSSHQTDKLINLLLKKEKLVNVLVVGGGTIGLGTEKIYHQRAINVISFDVYITRHTHFIADAHQIPLKDESIDAVIVQAVLEHVLDPYKVVAEIYRVLKLDGLVYAETPFMQQVHEGAYDFTRFTESGHRWLFKNFELIDSGAVRGVGVGLIWSIRYFVAALFRSNTIGTLAAACFFWLRFIEKIIPENYNLQGASCVFFLGKKSNDSISSSEIIQFYNRANE